MNRLVQAAFDRLYTTFAGVYDAVASAVSFGEWPEWGRTALHFVPAGARVLELAHGPGHVHAALLRGWPGAVGLDLSAQMGSLARARASRATGRNPSLVRASALHLPFPDARFDCMVSTFPTAFIFTREALGEIRRVLAEDGRAVIVPGAELTAGGPLAAAVRLAYRVTGQRETDAGAQSALHAFASAGFAAETHRRPTARATVTVWVLRPRG